MEEIKLTKQQKRDLKRKQQVQQGLRSPKVSKKKIRDIQAETNAVKDASNPNQNDNAVPRRIPNDWMKDIPKERLLREGDRYYEGVLQRSYGGFAIEQESSTDKGFHQDFQRALMELDNLDYYDFDFTQPLGLNTPLASTKVRRCLVGKAGSTYKYLGLRMFSFPLGDDEGLAFQLLNKCNDSMKARTKKLLQRREMNHAHEGYDYDIMLINKCYSASTASDLNVKLKPEPTFKDDLTSVSWHADSMLRQFSSIGVYNYVKDDSDALLRDWKIGLRVKEHIEGPSKNQKSFKREEDKDAPNNSEEVLAPPISVRVPHESIYYLLGSFNHHHEHCVLAGDASVRYSSTHRVARPGHTFACIRDRVKIFLGKKRQLESAKYIRHLIGLSSEVEFEWLRQWYVQGTKHMRIREWWHNPIQALLEYWKQLQLLLSKSISFMEACGTSRGKDDSPKEEAVNILISGLNDIIKLRDGWLKRENDPILERVDSNHRPIPFPEEVSDYKPVVARLRLL